MAGTAHSELGFPISTINQENTPEVGLMETVLQLSFLLSSWF